MEKTKIKTPRKTRPTRPKTEKANKTYLTDEKTSCPTRTLTEDKLSTYTEQHNSICPNPDQFRGIDTKTSVQKNQVKTQASVQARSHPNF